MDRLVVLSGCSGGGKSTLIEALAARGYAVVEEPGRRIVREELARGGAALPWLNPLAFAQRAVAMALDDWRGAASATSEFVFFDRSLIDAASAIEAITGENSAAEAVNARRYNRRVFLAPPWPEIFHGDLERRHSFDAAVAEHERLCRAFPAFGYETLVLPKTSVAARVDFIIEALTP